MFFLQFLSCVVSIFAGIVNGLNGLVALAEKYKAYIEQPKGKTENLQSDESVQSNPHKAVPYCQCPAISTIDYLSPCNQPGADPFSFD